MARKYVPADFQIGDPDQEISIHDAEAFAKRLRSIGYSLSSLSSTVRSGTGPGGTIPAEDIIVNGEAGIADAPICLDGVVSPGTGDGHNVRKLVGRLEVSNGKPTVESLAAFITDTSRPGLSPADAYVKAMSVDTRLDQAANQQLAKIYG